jgi:ubiquinone/menaquinone biosynthesis C-methylase UbiE
VRTSVDYDDHQHAVYDAGRSLTGERAEVSAQMLARHIAAGCDVLDLGCGTGVYSELVASRLDARVVGVDPSTRMLEVARQQHGHPRVRYLEGMAEQIPLDDAACDAALLSNVAHHVRDHDACAAELLRVLRPGGVVVLRGIRPRSIASVRFLEFFPSAQPIARQQSESLDRLIDTLARHMEPAGDETLDEELAPNLQAYLDRVKLRAISTLELIPDAEFEKGIETMRRVASEPGEMRPVVEQIDFVSLRRPG